jgi:hypothetical protein
VRTTANNRFGTLSPDGKWVAYTSDESGRPEIYVQPFHPGEAPKAKWQISTGGAGRAHWRRDGKEIGFPSNGKLMVVDVEVSGEILRPGVPRTLFTMPPGTGLAVSADHQSFLFGLTGQQQTAQPMVVTLNWMAAIKH